MSDEIKASEVSLRLERKEKLRRRLKAGVFTALLALGWAAQASTAQAAAPGPQAGLEERVQKVRDVLSLAPDTAGVTPGGSVQPWLNIWWNNWGNGWNNWSNAWNNWSNAWNNWNNWHNLWHNA